MRRKWGLWAMPTTDKKSDNQHIVDAIHAEIKEGFKDQIYDLEIEIQDLKEINQDLLVYKRVYEKLSITAILPTKKKVK